MEGGLSAMVENLPEDRYTLKSEKVETYIPTPNKADSDSEAMSSDEDSIFQGDGDKDEGLKYSLFDSVKQRTL